MTFISSEWSVQSTNLNQPCDILISLLYPAMMTVQSTKDLKCQDLKHGSEFGRIPYTMFKYVSFL